MQVYVHFLRLYSSLTSILPHMQVYRYNLPPYNTYTLTTYWRKCVTEVLQFILPPIYKFTVHFTGATQCLRPFYAHYEVVRPILPGLYNYNSKRDAYAYAKVLRHFTALLQSLRGCIYRPTQVYVPFFPPMQWFTSICRLYTNTLEMALLLFTQSLTSLSTAPIPKFTCTYPSYSSLTSHYYRICKFYESIYPPYTRILYTENAYCLTQVRSFLPHYAKF